MPGICTNLYSHPQLLFYSAYLYRNDSGTYTNIGGCGNEALSLPPSLRWLRNALILCRGCWSFEWPLSPHSRMTQECIMLSLSLSLLANIGGCGLNYLSHICLLYKYFLITRSWPVFSSCPSTHQQQVCPSILLCVYTFQADKIAQKGPSQC